MDTEHVLRNTRATLEIEFSVGAADGTVAVTAVGVDGNTVASGSAIHGTGGVYTYALAPQSAVNSLVVTWSGSWGGVAQSIQTHVEIVGGYIFSLDEIRDYDAGAVASTTSYGDAVVREVRAGVADMFEDVCGVAFVPKYALDVLDGAARRSLWLNHSPIIDVQAVTMDDAALDAGQLATITAYDYGKLDYPAWWNNGYGNITVEYEHGLRSVPWDIKRAALAYARQLLVATDVSDRTISYSNELGTFRNAVPGTNYPTGLPAVDAALKRHMREVVVRP